jgi:SAM-dependent methyltransferase
MPDAAPCPLCSRGDALLYHEDERRRYHRCRECLLIFVDPGQRPSREEESERYREHRNVAGDEGYEAFLRRLSDPVSARLDPGARGLDFGCGPEPVLAAIMARQGFDMRSYDPLFHPDPSVLTDRYDFITCSEVLEHVHEPGSLLPRLGSMLRPGGLLGIMTRFPGHEHPFATWWYRRDPTHLCFYGEETMQWLALRHDWRLEIPRRDVALFTMPQGSGDRADEVAS